MTKYDEPVAITNDIRLTVERLAALKKASGGLSFSECLSAEDEIRLRALAFLELYRRDRSPAMGEIGPVPDPDDLWERAGLVEIYFEVVPERLGPTSGGPSIISLPSVGTGE